MHESVESLFVVVAPLMEKRASVEKHGRKLLERQGRKIGVLFAYEVLVEPMCLFHLEAYSF
jgi:hypothetical protein